MSAWVGMWMLEPDCNGSHPGFPTHQPLKDYPKILHLQSRDNNGMYIINYQKITKKM